MIEDCTIVLEESLSVLLYPVISATFVNTLSDVKLSNILLATIHSISTEALSKSPVPEYACSVCVAR